MAPTSPPPAAPTRATPSAGRRWIFRLVSAIGFPLLLLGLVEGGLRVAGYGHAATFTVPCAAGGQPAFCENDRFTRPFFPPGQFRLPPSFAIPAVKEPGTFRIFVVGESAAQGDPEPSYAFGRYLEAMLRARFPSARFEVVNTGITAINSHVLLPAVRDLARHDPDLFVFYVGNNEVVGPFGTGTVLTARGASLPLIRSRVLLHSTRVGQLLGAALRRRTHHGEIGAWGGMEMFLDQQVAADSPGLARVYENFEANLRDMVAAARGSGARVLLSTIATNLRDCAPFASLHRRGLDGAEAARFEEQYKAGIVLEGMGRPAEALKRYRAAASIDDRFAELHFRLARTEEAVGDATAARAGYERARDLDALRFRADSTLNAIVRATAARAGAGVELIDAEAAVSWQRPGQPPGREAFWEHVHLTPEGNYAVARALFPHVAAQLPEAVRRAAVALEPPSREECDQRLALTSPDRLRVGRDVLNRLQRPPFTNQSNHVEQVATLARTLDGPPPVLADAVATYRRAIAEAPRDAWLRHNLALLLETNDPAGAAEQLAAVVEELPQDYASREKLAAALVRLGRFDEAVTQCRALLARMPYHPTAYTTMAYALARQGALDDAVGAYEQAVRLAPSLAADAYNEVGRIRLRQTRYDLAAGAFQRALDRGPPADKKPDLLFNLSHALRRAGRAPDSQHALAAAVVAYREELAREPRSAPAHYGLASALADSGDLAGASEHFTAAARLDPADVDAHLGAVRALEVAGRLDDALAAARSSERILAAEGQPAAASALRERAAQLAARQVR